MPDRKNSLVPFSSPHLMEVRERIRINGKPLPKDKFAKYFFDCWDNLYNNGDVSVEGKNNNNITAVECSSAI